MVTFIDVTGSRVSVTFEDGRVDRFYVKGFEGLRSDVSDIIATLGDLVPFAQQTWWGTPSSTGVAFEPYPS